VEGLYPLDYIRIQVAYARRMAELAHQPLAGTLLNQTSLYKMLGAQGDFDAADPIWRELLARLDAQADVKGQTRALHGYYLERAEEIAKNRAQHGDDRQWGCFAFDWRPQRRALRIHFLNHDAPTPGALSHQRMSDRCAELRAMFAVAREERPDANQVIGASWLYNLEAYRRLLPPQFGASAAPTEPEFQYRALWGQFLRSDWSLNAERADEFLGRVARLDDAAQFARCFPFQVLQTQAPITAFYAFYGL
jgi:hypothetical protein